MSFRCPFCLKRSIGCAGVAAAMLLTPASVVRARRGWPAGGVEGRVQADAAKPEAPTTGAAASSTDQANPAQKSAATRAIDKVKEVAKSAADIFTRVPCLAPKGGHQATGSLPHVANKLIAGQPVMIIAFGSSSTQGFGATSPEYTYPNRLAAQLNRTLSGRRHHRAQPRQGRRGCAAR